MDDTGAMGLKDWRVRRSLRDPVRGQFEVTGRYFAHPNGSSYREMLTGVVTGPGIAPTAGEHLDDSEGRYISHDVLPALVDRAEPAKFIVLWDELPKPDFRAEARAQAQQAADAARTGRPAGPPTPAPVQIHVDGGADGATPPWAAEMVADLVRQGVIPSDPSGTQGPITVQLPDQVVDLTGGRVTGGDADRLLATGITTTAVLLAVSDVPVPQIALPGPTATLCDLTLRVTGADGAGYETITRLGFRNAQRRAAIAVVGATLPVRVDPSDRTRVVVDSVAWDARHPGQ